RGITRTGIAREFSRGECHAGRISVLPASVRGEGGLGSAVGAEHAFAGFEEGFHAGKDAWPAFGDFWRHWRTGLEIVVDHDEANGVFDLFDFKGDAGFVA